MSLIKEGFIDEYKCRIFSDSMSLDYDSKIFGDICVYLSSKQMSCNGIACDICPVFSVCNKSSIPEFCDYIIATIYPNIKNDYPELFI